MSEPALAVAFFDPARELYGTARSGATLLFHGRRPEVVAGGPELEERDGGLHATLEGRLELDLEPVSEAAQLGGATVRVCRVRGRVDATSVECLGTLSETREAPNWEQLDALRSLSALIDSEHALLALARRPRGAEGHGEELVVAYLLEGERLLAVEDARISTVYDPEGRQRSAGLELWLPGEEFARRGSGVAVAGSSLELQGLGVHAAVFHWRIDGREGYGAYELMVRSENEPAAA